MKLIYSTNDLEHANRLVSALSEAGLAGHISGEHSARLPGFSAARTSSAVCVWLADAAELPRAREVMVLHGYLLEPSPKAPVAKHNTLWIVIIVAIVIAGLALLFAGGP